MWSNICGHIYLSSLRQAVCHVPGHTARAETPISSISTPMYLFYCHSASVSSSIAQWVYHTHLSNSYNTTSLPARRENKILPEMHVIQVFERKVEKVFCRKRSGSSLIPSLVGLWCSWHVGQLWCLAPAAAQTLSEPGAEPLLLTKVSQKT